MKNMTLRTPSNSNVLKFIPRVKPQEFIEDHLEVVLIVDCEDTRNLIKAALGYTFS